MLLLCVCGSYSQRIGVLHANSDIGDGFGASVSISKGTIVVGAVFEDSSADGVNGDQNNNDATDSGAAYVFVRDGTVWTQQAYLKASNTQSDDWFGCSVSISGDTIVVGANKEDSNATGVDGDQSNDDAIDSGAAYVFVRVGTTLYQQAYLKASNTPYTGYFGSSVSISGDTIVVGAWGEDSSAKGVNGDQNNNDATDSGAAYVFVREGTTWTQQVYLKASNTETIDGFGLSVSISGDTIVVGAPYEDSNAKGVNGDQSSDHAYGAGAVYVFERNGTTWAQQAYLEASNTGADDHFGYSVSISGDTIVVGANEEDSNATGVNGDQNNDMVSNSGAAYVFVRAGTTWVQQAYLKASNARPFDYFGISVSISGDVIVVGAWREDSNATGVNGDQTINNEATNSGAAYVFVRTGATWTQLQYLKASSVVENGEFGFSVSVDDKIVVGQWKAEKTYIFDAPETSITSSTGTGVPEPDSEADQIDDATVAVFNVFHILALTVVCLL